MTRSSSAKTEEGVNALALVDDCHDPRVIRAKASQSPSQGRSADLVMPIRPHLHPSRSPKRSVALVPPTIGRLYSVRTNLNVKVLDFVQLGGLWPLRAREQRCLREPLTSAEPQGWQADSSPHRASCGTGAYRRPDRSPPRPRIRGPRRSHSCQRSPATLGVGRRRKGPHPSACWRRGRRGLQVWGWAGCSWCLPLLLLRVVLTGSRGDVEPEAQDAHYPCNSIPLMVSLPYTRGARGICQRLWVA